MYKKPYHMFAIIENKLSAVDWLRDICNVKLFTLNS